MVSHLKKTVLSNDVEEPYIKKSTVKENHHRFECELDMIQIVRPRPQMILVSNRKGLGRWYKSDHNGLVFFFASDKPFLSLSDKNQ